MKRTLIILLVFFSVGQNVFAQADTILNRYRQYLFNTLTVQENTDQLITSINTNGQWNDIDYNSNERANWQPLIHMRRLRDLAFAYAYPKSSFFHEQKLLKAISLALQHWAEKKYKCPNWWHNEIGVPQQMRDIVVLLKNDLTPAQLKDGLEIIAQYKINDNSTGANLTWSADLGLHYALLTGDDKLTSYCRQRIVDEIKITTGDGVQPDYSFHQHDKRLQMYQYGAAFLLDNVRLAWELRNTSLTFPKDKIELLGDFLINGWQWMTRGINTVPGTMDRSASRKNALHSSDVRTIIPYFITLLPQRKKELTAILNHQNGKGALQGFRYYPFSDFAAYQQNDFSFFLKTISKRTLSTESINSENLKGHLLNSGDTYFINDGNEYFNLMPVWNWEYLPGVTSFKNAEKINRKSFVGSIGNGKTGFTSMDYVIESKDGKQSLSAKKSWFCYNGKVICLVADIRGKGVDTAYTTMDQCRLLGDVTVSTSQQNLQNGVYDFDNLKWVHHKNFVYEPLTQCKVSVRLENVSGTWAAINASESNAIVNDKTFMPIIINDNLKQSSSFAYMVAYCNNIAKANSLITKRDFSIVRNDSLCQAISFTDGTVMIAFFSPSSVSICNKNITADQPSLIMISNNKLYVSDPQQINNTVNVQINKRFYKVQLPKNGFTSKPILIQNK